MRNKDTIFIDNLIFYEQVLNEISVNLLEADDLKYVNRDLLNRFWGFLSNYVELVLEYENVRQLIFKLKDFELSRYRSPQIREKINTLFKYINEDYFEIKAKIPKDQLDDLENGLNYIDYYFTTDHPGRSLKYSYERFFQIITSNPFPEKFRVYGQPISEHYKNTLEVYKKLRGEILKKYNLDTSIINEKSFLIIQSLEDDFSFEFNGTLATVKLIQIYNQIHPAKPIPIDVYFYSGLESIWGIDAIEKHDIEEILHHIKHLNFLIKQYLSEGELKEHIALRFRTFCELYYKDLFVEEAESERFPSAEKYFQTKFNEFVFQNGYYPITEAQLNSGRLDTLMISEKQFLLYELKQIGFKKSQATEASIVEAIQSAKTQLISYHFRLNSLPYLDENVFIIICSKVPILFNETIVRESGLVFHVLVIDFSPYKDSEKSKHTIYIGS